MMETIRPFKVEKSPMDIVVRPIGVIRSPFKTPSEAPIQASRSQARGQVEVFPEFQQGLTDLEGFSHIYLVYVFHEVSTFSLLVKPFLDDKLHGIFATRHPERPNRIGFSIVKLLGRNGNILESEGVDMLDGTPLLDIKPYMPEFDERKDVRIGWYGDRKFD